MVEGVSLFVRFSNCVGVLSLLDYLVRTILVVLDGSAVLANDRFLCLLGSSFALPPTIDRAGIAHHGITAAGRVETAVVASGQRRTGGWEITQVGQEAIPDQHGRVTLGQIDGARCSRRHVRRAWRSSAGKIILQVRDRCHGVHVHILKVIIQG